MCCDNLAFLKAPEGRRSITAQRDRVELIATRRVARRTVAAFWVERPRKLWAFVVKRRIPKAGDLVVAPRADVRPK